ncbi:adhesion G-protein coupled receptor D1-like [Strongylocentrotus purpuratus]|uniref:G-protein coupled receptors family 2 profile 2 domain-containing protein n=1 Tax=Strongylocentrotus purpuratus TaxID=7668 RepID=A0A7M7T1K4_STRPU|nr:adhesion G-protein coupled receptor D1-like [Strongylocentrotus purpuratus]
MSNLYKGSQNDCWLNPTDGTIWAFTGPAIAIVLVNVVILLLVVKTVVSASRGQLDNDKIKQIKAGLRSTLLLFPLLGIAWLLTPVVAVFPHVKALEYTFNLLNSLQGFFVAWLYCFLNSEVRNAIREHVRKSRESRASNTNPSTVSTTEGSAAKPGMRLIRVAPAPVGPTQNQAVVSSHST